jgi:hypothetical protein
LEQVVLAAAEPVPGRAGRALLARDGDVVLDMRLASPPDVPPAHWEPLPELLPLLLQLPVRVPTVAVRVDVTGGEILVGEPDLVPRPAERVHAGEFPVHKVPAGGMSHLSMQQRVEESWRRNVTALAERVNALVSDRAARVLVLAGDAQSRSRLRDALSARAAAIAVDVEHSSGATDDELAAAVAEAVLDRATGDRHAVLRRYEENAGRRDGLGVDGLEPVLAALRAEQVEVLLMHGDAPPEAEVWITERPTLLGTDAEQLRAAGAEPVATVRADAALLRAAVAGGASFELLGGGRTGLVGQDTRDGVAALLRYPLVRGDG